MTSHRRRATPTHRLAWTIAAAGVALIGMTGTLTWMQTASAGGGGGDEPQHVVGEFTKPIVVGHRGASGYRPEHTLAAYELAAQMGADYIEPDLVATKDGVLVTRHENEISGTTDVAQRPEFADRKTTKVIDGQELQGWFTEDFTLKELKSLRAIERIPEERQENTLHDRRYEVATFDEVLTLRERLSNELGREIGVIPELKHPSYFDSLRLSMEEPVLESLRKAGLDHEDAPASIQSFELANLVDLNRRLEADVPLTFLSWYEGQPQDFIESGDPRTYADLMTKDGMVELAKDVDIIGPEKTMVVPVGEDGTLQEATDLVTNAHQAGLQVMPYTFRAENSFLPPALQSSGSPADYGDLFAEINAHLDAGVDGFFTDQPDLGVEAKRAWLAEASD